MRGSFTYTSVWQTVCTLCSFVEEVGWNILLGLSCAFFGIGGLRAKAYSSVNWQLHLSLGNWGGGSPRSLICWKNWGRTYEMYLKHLSLICKGKLLLHVFSSCWFIFYDVLCICLFMMSIRMCLTRCIKHQFLCMLFYWVFFFFFYYSSKPWHKARETELSNYAFSVLVKKATGWEITRQHEVATPVSPPSLS